MSGPAAVVGRGVNELIQPATRPFTAAAWSAGAMVADFRTAWDRTRMTVAWSPSAARAWARAAGQAQRGS